MPANAPYSDDVQRILDDLDANLRRAEALVRDLDEAQFAWQPSPGSWSIAQCLDHLNVANRAYLAPMREAAEKARQQGRRRRGPIRQGFVERWFTRSMEPPPSRRLPAPKKAVPTLREGKERIAGDFRRIQGEAEALLREAADLDMSIRFQNPFFPLARLTVGSGFLIIAAHERRHLWQAERVRERPEFPAPPRV